QGALRGLVYLLIDLVRDALQHVPVDHALLDQKLRKANDGVALGFSVALGGRLIEPFVVRKRVRVGSDDVGVHQGGAVPGAAILRRGLQGAVRRQKIGAVDLQPEQVRKTFEQLRYTPASGLALDGDGDRVGVIFNQDQQRQAREAGGIERLPELAL